MTKCVVELKNSKDPSLQGLHSILITRVTYLCESVFTSNCVFCVCYVQAFIFLVARDVPAGGGRTMRAGRLDCPQEVGG